MYKPVHTYLPHYTAILLCTLKPNSVLYWLFPQFVTNLLYDAIRSYEQYTDGE